MIHYSRIELTEYSLNAEREHLQQISNYFHEEFNYNKKSKYSDSYPDR